MTHNVYLKSFCMVMRLTCISFCHSQCSPLADSFGRRLIGIVVEILLCWFMCCLVAWKTHTHISFLYTSAARAGKMRQTEKEGRKERTSIFGTVVPLLPAGKVEDPHEHFSSTLKASPPFPRGVQTQENTLRERAGRESLKAY